MACSILEAAAGYAERGWRVIPLHARDKRPHPKAWQKAATVDPEVIDGWWRRWPDANVGVALGKDSGVIDVECDSPEAEQLLQDLFGGELPFCPTFQSTRGKHRLFAWSADLPEPGQAVFKIGPNKSLEFRTGGGNLGAQTVFPPSVHPSGVAYRWLPGLSIDDVEPPQIPGEVLARIQNYVLEGTTQAPKGGGKSRDWQVISSGEIPEGGGPDGGRNATTAAWVGKRVGQLADPFDEEAAAFVWDDLQRWNLQVCKPPQDIPSLRRTFESVLRKHRQRVTDELAGKELRPSYARTPEGDAAEGGWKLIGVQAKPPYFLLESPIWPGQQLRLTSSELVNPKLLREVAANQVFAPVSKYFAKIWDGKPGEPGLYERLMRSIELRMARPEERRDVVIAEHLWDALAKAREGEEPDITGIPVKLPDGSVWFRLNYLHQQMQFSLSDLKHRELVDVLCQFADRTDCRIESRGRRTRFKRVSAKEMQRLEQHALQGAVEQVTEVKRAEAERPAV